MASTTPNSSSSALPEQIKKSIEKEYAPHEARLLKEAREILDWQELTFAPNFEQNYNILATAQIDLGDHRGRRLIEQHLDPDWQDKFAQFTMEYFDGLVLGLDQQKFRDDDMMQGALKDIVAKAVIELRVERSLELERRASRCVILDGKLVIQTWPPTRAVHPFDCAYGLVELL